MKKFLLTIAALMSIAASQAQKVTLDFTNAVEDWNLPAGKDNAATSGSYTCGDYTITLAGEAFYVPTSTDKTTGTVTVSKYLLLGKQDATLTLPAFDFAVGTIKVYGNKGASTTASMNVFVGETAVSTEAVNSVEDHTFAINEANQAAGTVYTYKVTNAKNVQITKIEIFEAGESVDPEGGEIEGTITVAEAQAAAAGTTATVQGSVYATGASSFVVGDKTGFIFHYGAADVKVGDVVTVTGEVSAYGGFNQFKSAKVEVVSAGTVTYPTPTIMTGAEMDEWVAAPDIDYVQITGKLTISGNYYNVNVEGAEKAVGSIIAPNDEIKAKLANGNTYVLTGFAMYQSGTNKYMNIVVTDAKAEGETVELNDISNTIETAYTVSEAIKLIEDEKSDLSKTVYVKGIISAPLKEGNPICDTQYGNATFFISADGSTEGEQFEIYRGYWFEGAKFTAEDQLKIGDAVIFECTITKYTHSSGDVVYETNTGAKLVSLNGSTDAIQGITAEKDAVIYDLAGRRVSKAGKGLYIINGKKVMK